MKRTATLLAALALALSGLVAAAPPASATTWSGVRSMSDCAGNGCLTVYYQVDLSDSAGFTLVSVKISAAGAGTLHNYQGTDGKGASCWNDRNVIKWSKGNTATSLDPGTTKEWNPTDVWSDATSLTCGWYYADLFITSGPINECAKVKAYHASEQTGGCSAGRSARRVS